MQWLIVAGAAIVVILVLLRVARGKWDLIALHSQSLTRHTLSAVLMAGTLAGTLWTFSNGRISFSGLAETVLSVGGIAIALEAGAIFTGLQIGAVDRRIMTAKASAKADLIRYRRTLFYWFGGVVALSAVANFAFRWQQFQSLFTASISAAAPVVLICLLTIVLRPIPADYSEMGRQSVARGLVGLANEAQKTLHFGLRRIARGESLDERDLRNLQFAAGMLKAWAPVEQQQVLDHALAHGAGAPTIIDTTAIRYLSSTDVQAEYGVSRRTAQLWIQACPGKMSSPRGKGFVAPASDIYAQRGLPATSREVPMLPGGASRNARNDTQAGAEGAQDGAPGAQIAATDAQSA